MAGKAPPSHPRAGKRDAYTPAQVITALELSAGIFARAAAQLGCCRSTISNYVSRYAEIQTALERILEDRLDLSETVLIKAMTNEKNPAQQLGAVTFYLRFKGASRGYGERHRAIAIDLPPVNSLADISAAHGEVFAKCAAGAITPAEAKALGELLEMRRRVIVDVETEARLQAVEKHLAQTGLGHARH